ncbi:MAG: DinB family protein [Vicinamibacterales bacterium]|jgi:uncharacterized damage-inducible protein DinB|nr:DinB family protein [Vicinamibacterales bacterium]
MSSIVASVEAEYRRYKALGEGVFAQLDDDELNAPCPRDGNSIAVIVWHVAGNLASRFTNFLTADGEKPWRQREEEFAQRTVSRQELMTKWEHGWSRLLDVLSDLTDDHLTRTVTIREQPLRVHEALHRSLAHVSYHVGQIVYVAKSHRGDAWRSLSIPPGASTVYNENPRLERPVDHATTLNRQSGRD